MISEEVGKGVGQSTGIWPSGAPEADVHSSAHTALVLQSVASRSGDSRDAPPTKASRCPLPRPGIPVGVAPSLQPHYGAFLATSSKYSAPVRLCARSVPSRSRLRRLRVSPAVGTTGSRVPRKSPDHVLATSMPDAARAVDRHPSDSCGGSYATPGLDVIRKCFETSTAVPLHSTPRSSPDRVSPRLFPTP